MNSVISRNSEAEQYICAARKNFITDNTVSESDSKMLICHFTDIHGDVDRFNNVLRLIEYYKPDFAIHTGDLVTWNSAENTDYFMDKISQSAVPIYNSIGNHETFGKDGLHAGGPLTNEYLHKRYIAPLKNIKADSRKGWYYADFDKNRLRLIVLNPYEYYCESDYQKRGTLSFLQEQCDWLISVLEDAADKDYAVIIAAHEFAETVSAGANELGFCQRFEPYPWGVPNRQKCFVTEDIADTFISGGTLEKEYICSNSGQKISVSCTFKKRGEFICYLAGHRHGDYVGYLPSHSSQLSVTMTCSGCFPQNYHNIGEELSDLARIPGTVSEDAVNFYVIDRKRKTLSIVRVGAAVNDLLVKRQYLVLPYKKGCAKGS